MDRIQTVVFDCDGVLVDSEPLGLESFRRALFDQGIDYPFDGLRRFCGVTSHESLQTVLEETASTLDREQFLLAKQKHYENLLEERGLNVFDGVLDLLNELERDGITAAVATSGSTEKVRASFRLTGLDGRFKIIVNGDDIEHGKPAPDIYLKAARLCGCGPSECVAVEDTPPGLKSARAAGMHVVGVAHTFPEDVIAPLCDRFFTALSDIRASKLLHIPSAYDKNAKQRRDNKVNTLSETANESASCRSSQ